MKRILVSIPKGAWEIIEKTLKGKMGEKDSELVRNILLTYLSEKGYMHEEVSREAAAAGLQPSSPQKPPSAAAEKKEDKAEGKKEPKEEGKGEAAAADFLRPAS